jgi:hypothetical protein
MQASAGFLPRDFEMFRQSAIPEELARRAFQRVDSYDGHQLLGKNSSADFSGLAIAYRWPGDSYAREYRLRLDNPEFAQDNRAQLKEGPRYQASPGSRNVLYFAPDADPRSISDIEIPIVIVEGEKKTLSLSALSWHSVADSNDKPRFLPIGLSGVWNFRGTNGITENQNGERVPVKGIIADFDKIAWKGRHVTICFDTNLNTNESVQAARRILARELKALGAIVSLMNWPDGIPAGVNGIDDYIALEGSSAALKLLEAAKSEDELQPAEIDYIEFAPSFMAVEDPPIQYLVNELLPEGVLALIHSEPRVRKSWMGAELAICGTAGRPLFGLTRFAVNTPFPVLYNSQEDSARPIRNRVKRLLAGYKLDVPQKLAFSIHKNIDLEQEAWQKRLLRDIERHGFKVVIFDPIRRFAESVDKGPSEVRKITAFLRKICTETGASVVIIHHDVKPNSQGPDSRRRSHKASGGDWFAACECPIALEPAGENTSLVIPEDFKFSTDPSPFTFRIEEDPERTWARLVGEDSAAEAAVELVAQEKLLNYLTENPGASGSGIAKALRIRKDDVLNTLCGLELKNKVDCIKAEKKGKADRWFLRKETAE